MEAHIRGTALACSNTKCKSCFGHGTVHLKRAVNGEWERVCQCSAKKVFDKCLKKYKYHLRVQRMETPRLSVCRGRFYSFRNEEYQADFYWTAYRVLDDLEWSVFRLHFLCGIPYYDCTPKLGVNRGDFFHAVYRVKTKVGLECIKVKPYELYPFQVYFHK